MSVVNLRRTSFYGGTYEVSRVMNIRNRAASFDWASLEYMILLTLYLAVLGQSRRMIQF